MGVNIETLGASGYKYAVSEFTGFRFGDIELHGTVRIGTDIRLSDSWKEDFEKLNGIHPDEQVRRDSGNLVEGYDDWDRKVRELEASRIPRFIATAAHLRTQLGMQPLGEITDGK